MVSPPRDSVASWRAARLHAVTSVPGNLALISYQPVTSEPAPIDAVPKATVRDGPDAGGIVVSAGADLGMTVDDVPIDGDMFVPRSRPDGTPVIRAGRYAFDVFSLDDTGYELRVFDELAENLAHFNGIDCYDYADSLVLAGEFTEYSATDEVSWDFTRSADSGHTKRVPGTVAVTVHETPYELLAFLDGDELVLVFADATTGPESYAPGRFLRIPRPDGGSGLVVDFNRAFIPPCGFSDFYSCPIPPPQNKLTVPVRAGEKRVLWKERHDA